MVFETVLEEVRRALRIGLNGVSNNEQFSFLDGRQVYKTRMIWLTIVPQ